MNTQIRNSEIVFRSQIAGVERVVDRDLIRECREYVAANEESAKEYLNRYFIINEASLLELGTTMLSEFLYMLVDDIEKTPGISYSDKTWLPPATPTQSPEAVVHLKWLKVPERLSGLKCYRLTPRMFVVNPPNKLFIAPSDDLKAEEYTMAVLPVFHLSSFLALMHRRFPLTEKAIEEYERNKSLKELRSLVSSLQASVAKV